MKIGVALSGCGYGSLAATAVLETLIQEGVPIGMVAASGLPAIGALLHATFGYEHSRELAHRFLSNWRESDLATALVLLCEEPDLNFRSTYNLAIASVNIPDRRAVFFCKDIPLVQREIVYLPLHPLYAMLQATINPAEELAPLRSGELLLCDYSCCFGPPLSPLRMAGMDKVVHIAFQPDQAHSPYELALDSLNTSGAPLPDISLRIVAPADAPLEKYDIAAISQVKSCIKQLYLQTLF